MIKRMSEYACPKCWKPVKAEPGKIITCTKCLVTMIETKKGMICKTKSR